MRERPLGGGPTSTDDWWDNLLNSFRRYDSEHMPGVRVDVSLRGRTVTAVTDVQGYYEAQMSVGKAGSDQLWETAEVRRNEGGPAFLQPVRCVPQKARFGQSGWRRGGGNPGGVTH